MEELEQQEVDQPFDLTVKAKLIELYRSRGALVDLTQVKERYLEVAPLPEGLWLEWLESFSSRDLYLYTKALKDFPCNLQLDPQVLLKLFNQHEPASTTVFFEQVKTKTRDSQVWLSFISKLQDKNLIRTTFKELFLIPRAGLDLCWKKYEEWEEDQTQKSLMKILFLSSFNESLQEQEIASRFASLARLSLTHLKTLQKHTKPIVHPYLYEELLIRSPQSADIWEDYIFSQIRAGEACTKTCKRAVRNNPTCVSLWSLLILSYESLQKSSESNKKSEKMQKSLLQPFEDASCYTQIWREYCESLKRSGKDYLGALMQGEHWLKTYCPPQHLVLKAFRGSLTKELKLFEEIVKEQPGTSSCWEVYIKFLQENSLKDQLREVFKRALDSCKDSNEIIKKFLEWETREEDLNSLIECKVLCQKRKIRDVEVVSLKTEKFKMKSQEKSARFTAFIHNLPGNVKEYHLDEVLRQIVRVKAVRIVRDRKGNSRGIAYCDFESQEDLDYAVANLNQREICGNIVNVAVSRPPELEKNEEKTVFVNNLPFSCTEELLKSTFSSFGDVFQVRVIKNSEGRCKGYSYVVFAEKSAADLAVTQSSLTIDGRNVTIEKYQETKEQKFVLHVSNLPFDVTDRDLADLFPTATSVTCPVDRNGKTRGFGFVEFSTEAEANEVLELSAPMVGGRYIVVKRSYKKVQERKLDNKDFKKFL